MSTPLLKIRGDDGQMHPVPILGGEVKVGDTAGQALFTGEGGIAVARTAAEARGLLGVAPALMGNVTIYVSTTGSDATRDGSAAKPFGTIQYAVDSVPKNLNARTATINIADGVYDEGVSATGFTAGTLVLRGNTVNGTIIRNIAVLHSQVVQIEKCTLKKIGVAGISATGMIHAGGDSCVVLGDIVIDCAYILKGQEPACQGR